MSKKQEEKRTVNLTPGQLEVLQVIAKMAETSVETAFNVIVAAQLVEDQIKKSQAEASKKKSPSKKSAGKKKASKKKAKNTAKSKK